ncbi:MAG: hypothetical protein H7Y43_10175 [Akkermansiaceae bacterium]|nr:hypothetical protein [Verrucomicrobiales bacterium]
MKKIHILPFITLVALVLGSGCASIVDGGDKSVQINSNPSGAKVTIADKNGKPISVQTTPAVVSLKRHHGFFQPEKYKLTFEAPGYYPAEASVSSRMNGWYAGNVLFGGLLGILIVDPATGAMWTLSPRELTWNLVSSETALNEEQLKTAQLEANPPKKVKPATVNRSN